jgi:hypothetical protein
VVITNPHFAAATALALAGGLPPRKVAQAPLRQTAWLLADAALPLTVYGLLLALTAKPLFAAIVAFMLGCGYAFADRSKRKVLAEPIVLTDVFQAVDIFRHPELALPFPHKGRLAAGLTVVLAACAAVFRLEPAVWHWSPWPPALALSLPPLIAVLLSGPLNTAAARLLRRGGLSGDPLLDGVRCGPFASLLGYGILARAERGERQARARPAMGPKTTVSLSRAEPVVLVQSESFFDARRLHRGIRKDLLPAFDHLARSGSQWGRLAVPSWGANTVRTEFSVLSGLTQEQIGFDRFNPYHRFAAAPITSLAWRLRSEGYRTICLHPFDPRFYNRNQVMRNLGFDAFLAEDAFIGAQRVNGYVSDLEMARVAKDILREEGPRVFLFLITMENHGPWTGDGAGPLRGLAPGLTLPQTDRHALQRYLLSLRSADAMLQTLSEAVCADGRNGVLGFYGDHLPAFSSLFRQCGLSDLRTDYLVWRRKSLPGGRVDIDACQLGEALLRARMQHARTVRSERRPGDQALS